nr:MAG TPA: hypothetical protein [Caudoviricetes sp.]
MPLGLPNLSCEKRKAEIGIKSIRLNQLSQNNASRSEKNE